LFKKIVYNFIINNGEIEKVGPESADVG